MIVNIPYHAVDVLQTELSSKNNDSDEVSVDIARRKKSAEKALPGVLDAYHSTNNASADGDFENQSM